MSIIFKEISITLNKTPSTAQQVLVDNFNYTIADGTVLTIMGSSGTGKSTLLHYITGIYDKSAFRCNGQVIVQEKNILLEKTEHRKIGLLSQEGLLFPHMTVKENLLYAVPRSETQSKRDEIIKRSLEEAQLNAGFAHKYPYTLSGGQQARLALVRTLLSEPKILLLDEPFSKLDEDLRNTIRTLVWNKIEQYKIPTLLVTHDKRDVHDTRLVFKL